MLLAMKTLQETYGQYLLLLSALNLLCMTESFLKQVKRLAVKYKHQGELLGISSNEAKESEVIYSVN